MVCMGMGGNNGLQPLPSLPIQFSLDDFLISRFARVHQQKLCSGAD